MDVATLSVLRPVLIVVAACLVPVLLIFTRSYFKHKEQELELERELRKHEITHGAAAFEARLRALETAVQHLAASSPYLSAPPQGEQQQAPSLPATKLPQG